MVFFHQYPIKVVVSLHFPNIPHFSSFFFFQSTWKSFGKDGCVSRATAPALDSHRHADLTSARQFTTSFFIFHSPICANSGQNWLKSAKTHVKKKKKLELISYLVINLLYICQISCRLNNLNWNYWIISSYYFS